MKNTVVNILLTLYLLLIVGAYLIGARPLIVASNSMAPTLSKGDLVLVIFKNNYEIGDIISFDSNDEIATHRVFSKVGDNYKLKGDANKMADLGSISSDQIIGKVQFVFPLIGFILLIFQSKYFVFFSVIFVIMYLVVKYLYVQN